ncbi:APC family permease [Irregularibacter muris]|uniref:APC family permease n=1 Tax=Irregularibacter muris TaxID=1796619 RepID=A0AAE3HF30_9FIRM|nr:APC family permease [Irregularibacter muris]MCR1898931.1 APC family permease [Irregularibacter muris]
MTKKLNRIDIFSLVLGSIIGWGSFTLPGTKFLQESGVINTAIGFLIGGIAVVFIQKGYHIMMQNHGEDGGEFSYTYNHLGSTHGFIVGWGLILCYLSLVPLNATAFVLVVKKILGPKIEILYLYSVAGYPVYLSEVFIASFIIILFAYINIKGLKASSCTQNIMVLFLILNIIIVFVSMLFLTDKTIFLDNYILNYQFDLGEISKVLAIVPFLFVGFDVIPQVSTDLDFKPEKATRIAIISIFSGVLGYNLLNMTTSLVFSPQGALKQEWALGTAVMDNIGYVGFLLLLVALAAAVTGGINGFMLSSSKLIAALADYQFLSPKYREKNENGVYAKGIKFVAMISLIAPWVGREVIIYIVDMCSLSAALAYFYVCYISYTIAVERKEKVLSSIGGLVSLIFILLLIFPWSPGRLSIPSLIFTVLWAGAGYLYYRRYCVNTGKVVY